MPNITFLDFSTDPPTETVVPAGTAADIPDGSIVLYPAGTGDAVDITIAQIKNEVRFKRQGALLATLDIAEGDHARSVRLAPWLLEGRVPFWEDYSNTNFLEELADDPTIDADSSAGEFYFNTTNEVWREIVDNAGTLEWQDNSDITTLLGTGASFEGVFADEDAANAAISTPYSATSTYYAYFGSQVQYLRGQTANGIKVVKAGTYGYFYVLLPTTFQTPNQLGYILSIERDGTPINQKILPFGFNDRAASSLRGRMADDSIYYFSVLTAIFGDTHYFGIQTSSPLSVSAGENFSFKLYYFEY